MFLVPLTLTLLQSSASVCHSLPSERLGFSVEFQALTTQLPPHRHCGRPWIGTPHLNATLCIRVSNSEFAPTRFEGRSSDSFVIGHLPLDASEASEFSVHLTTIKPKKKFLHVHFSLETGLVMPHPPNPTGYSSSAVVWWGSHFFPRW